tara:strand:+ start:248 stop:664 length:417 start_codon:yes stop_codon:yes gene_type:complete
MCVGPSKKTQPRYDRQVEKEKEKIRSVRPDATDEQVEGGAKRLAIQNVFLDPDARKPLSTPTPTPVATPAPTPSEPEPKMRVINRTVKAGTTVRGQQRTQSAAPSRRRRQSARMGRRSGTSSLRIARNPNTGSGNLNY